MSKLAPVKSSNIKAVGYDKDTKRLTVQFHGGSTHTYEGVAPEKHAGMMGVGQKDHSVGAYFHKHIKNAHPSKKEE